MLSKKEIIEANNTLGSLLLHSQTQIHIFHLQTNSYAVHKALETYYKKIDNLLDNYIETFQGKYGILMNYIMYPINNSNKTEISISYLQNLQMILYETSQNKLGRNDGDIRNILDEISDLINKTLYKLINLQ